MPSASSSKLTKKQKKALAFRERKGKGKGIEQDESILDVPVPEDQDLAEVAGDAQKVQTFGASGSSAKGRKHERKTEGQGDGQRLAKKRKRGEGEDGVDIRAAPAAEDKKEHDGEGENRRKKRKDKAATDDAGDVDEEGNEVSSKSNSKQRFILFVGNLKYTTTKLAIEEHFSTCDPPPVVRLLTSKQTRAGTTVAKSKGCAFLEFTNKSSLQQALKLHHSTLDSRKINVELTAGGGGKSENRLAKLKERNKELATQRTKKLQKAASNGEQVQPDRPQRFSTTSGEGDAPMMKRTWTVGDEDDGQTHRGGKKHVKKKTRGARSKPLGTGVNAIPVG
ncbi:hypothetical protein EW146_g2454 [Bondarzewia mesenterica]|uniref:RRM domain-containing protein n=1 Tax=Bondarzewia mesenterica TaxID=1095465 RepID=A0A4S4M0J5_9AGAM|nr:hypothetical protein EW146_g2454 [Bondarzewia mesenterica]